MRYLFPLPVPQRWRRHMIALGSGDPTRIICSALIAQAFEPVRYPILPKVTQVESEPARQEILEIRHSSLYTPRDFDISPYFAVVKPTICERLRLQEDAMGRSDVPTSRAVESLRRPATQLTLVSRRRRDRRRRGRTKTARARRLMRCNTALLYGAPCMATCCRC